MGILDYSFRNREALQRRAAIKTVSAYRMVSGAAAGILSLLSPANLLVEERATGHDILREHGQLLDAEDRLVMRGEWVKSLIRPNNLER